MSYIKTSEKNRAIKKALVAVYGAKNVSVTGDRGTAYGWVRIDITLPNTGTTPDEYRKLYSETSQKVRDIARQALKEIGAEFYTYTSDDGYNTEHECVMIQIHEMTA